MKVHYGCCNLFVSQDHCANPICQGQIVGVREWQFVGNHVCENISEICVHENLPSANVWSHFVSIKISKLPHHCVLKWVLRGHFLEIKMPQ